MWLILPWFQKQIKNITNKFLMNMDIKILNKIQANQIATYEKNYTPWLSGIFPRNARLIYHLKINTLLSIKKHKQTNKKPHMIISINTEEEFDKTQPSFMIKETFRKVGTEGNFNLIHCIYEKYIAVIIRNTERLVSSP